MDLPTAYKELYPRGSPETTTSKLEQRLNSRRFINGIMLRNTRIGVLGDRAVQRVEGRELNIKNFFTKIQEVMEL